MSSSSPVARLVEQSLADWRLRRCLDDESETASSIAASDKSTRASMASSHLKRTLGDDDIDDEEEDDIDSCVPLENDDVDVYVDVDVDEEEGGGGVRDGDAEDDNVGGHSPVVSLARTSFRGRRGHANRRHVISTSRDVPTHHVGTQSHGRVEFREHASAEEHFHCSIDENAADDLTPHDEHHPDFGDEPDDQDITSETLTLQSNKTTYASRLSGHRRSSSASSLSSPPTLHYPPPQRYHRTSLPPPPPPPPPPRPPAVVAEGGDAQSLSSEGFASPSTARLPRTNRPAGENMRTHQAQRTDGFTRDADVRPKHHRSAEKMLRAMFVRELLLNSIGLDRTAR